MTEFRPHIIRLTLIAVLCALTPTGGKAQGTVARDIRFDTVTVTGFRYPEQVGTQRTVLDSLALRDNVTHSLADVLSQHSTLFVKSYGRATLSTVSFRGTAPSHTQVTWNGMKINSPMLGMVDFSLIPSYFIDEAILYHGASSTGSTGGGLGGAVALETKAEQTRGFYVDVLQGIGSFGTYDEYLRLYGGRGRTRFSTRAYYAFSDNDFSYRNYRKKIYVTDEDGHITDSYFPKERNKNGSFKDFHLLQEVYHTSRNGDEWDLTAWYMDSRRGVPMLNVDYKEESDYRTRQNEKTLRTSAGWRRDAGRMKLSARAGYQYTDMLYTYMGDQGVGTLAELIRSESYVNTFHGNAGIEYIPQSKWHLSMDLAVHRHEVQSRDQAVLTPNAVLGYNKARTEFSGFASVRYKSAEGTGIALTYRQEVYGSHWTPAIPALFAEQELLPDGSLRLKTSAARNYRQPTLNDLYFMPGGNDTLRPEKGITWDGGLEYRLRIRAVELDAEATVYWSDIRDWIIWLPDFKGFWTPKNVRKVSSRGFEFKGNLTWRVDEDLAFRLSGNYTITRSINHGDPVNWLDESIGKQLVYIPKYSSAVTGMATYRDWQLVYKWNYYSRRYTTSSNETAFQRNVVGAYYMNGISLERIFRFGRSEFSVKGSVDNLFGEEYESVLSRPMAGRTFGLYIGLKPRFGR